VLRALASDAQVKSFTAFATDGSSITSQDFAAGSAAATRRATKAVRLIRVGLVSPRDAPSFVVRYLPKAGVAAVTPTTDR
jgi:hypothetical protein